MNKHYCPEIYLGTPNSGTVDYTQEIGATARIKCNPGYVYEGPHRGDNSIETKCVELDKTHGTWDPEPAGCMCASCVIGTT